MSVWLIRTKQTTSRLFQNVLAAHERRWLCAHSGKIALIPLFFDLEVSSWP